nr:immunoglobulin heavy chain junction region [Mus musculus]
CARSPYFDYW